MNVDIVVVTHNRPEQLKRTISELFASAQQTSKNAALSVKLYVLVNGDCSKSLKVLNDLKVIYSSFEIIVETSKQTLKPGAARNQLISLGESNWVYFIDDDAYPKNSLFTEMQLVLKEYPQAVMIGGPNGTWPSKNICEMANGAVLESTWGTLLSKPRYASSGSLRKAKECELSSCNLLIRRSAFSKAMYPTHYQTAEENHLILELLSEFADGCFYDPKLMVYHKRRSDPWLFAKQIFRYALGRAHLIVDKGAFSLVHFLPSLALAASLLLLVVSPYALSYMALIYAVVTFGAAGAAGLRTRSVSIGLCTFPLFVLAHACYALGIVTGLLKHSFAKHRIFNENSL